MIENNQKFDLITNFEEITSRPNYIEKVLIQRGDSAEGVLLDLVGYYLFRDKVKCGISSCGTKHQKGYIASLNTGSEIIIGHECGKKYFGISFDDKAGQFAHLKDNAKQYMRVKEAFEGLDSMISQYQAILSSTGKMSYVSITKAIKEFKNGVLGYWIHKDIESGISSNGTISRSEFKTKDEIAAERVMREVNGRSGYVSEHKTIVLANVSEWSVLADWHKAQNLKDWFDILHREIKNPNSMQPESVKKVYKKLTVYDGALRELRDFCSNGNKLFQSENLNKLALIFQREQDKRVIEDFAKRFV